MTHWVWKVLVDDNNTINFQSFSSLWEEEKHAPKATSAAPVPNQGHDAGWHNLKASAASQHWGIPATTTFFSANHEQQSQMLVDNSEF